MKEQPPFTRWQQWGWPIFTFLLAFLPRAIYSVTRAPVWYGRSILFGDAILAQNWFGTYQQYHPGVTTMWLSGISLKIFGDGRNLTSAQLLGEQPAPVGTIVDAYNAGVIGLALAICICIILIQHRLSDLINPQVGIIAGILLAIDPFYLSNSKVLHVDALVATFMLTSAIYFISFMQQNQKRHLILSGIFAGFAFLTKSPSIFLIPFVTLMAGMYSVRPPKRGASIGQRLLTQFKQMRGMVTILFIWGGLAALLFFILFPAMWVDASTPLRMLAGRVVFHINIPHYNALYFNGQTITEDPGLPFYIATLLWRTTFLTLPMLIVTSYTTLKRVLFKEHHPTIWWLLIYLGAFTIQMGLAARKEMRYLLPAFPVIDVLAAYGLVHLSQLARQWRPTRPKLPTAVLIIPLLLQAILVLAHHPYYGTHYNYLLGGPYLARHIIPLQEQTEGLDQAGLYLSTLPNAEKATAVMHSVGAEMFKRYFIGTTDPNTVNPEADYRIYHVNQVMRGLGEEEWMQAWAVDQQTDPLWTIEFGGITYVWIYGKPPE